MTKKRVLKKVWHNANLSLNVAFFRNEPHATSTAGWRLITFPCGMPACVTPRETSHSPKGSFCIYTYICEMFVCFGSYLFALLAKWLSTSTQEDDRPEPVVAVCARSEHCSSRGVLSKFFPAGVNKTIYDFPGFSMRPILYVRTTGKMLSVFVALSHEHSPGHIPQVCLLYTSPSPRDS